MEHPNILSPLFRLQILTSSDNMNKKEVFLTYSSILYCDIYKV